MARANCESLGEQQLYSSASNARPDPVELSTHDSQRDPRGADGISRETRRSSAADCCSRARDIRENKLYASCGGSACARASQRAIPPLSAAYLKKLARHRKLRLLCLRLPPPPPTPTPTSGIGVLPSVRVRTRTFPADVARRCRKTPMREQQELHYRHRSPPPIA